MSPHHWTDDDSYRPDELPSAVVVPDDARGQGHILGAMLESTRRARGKQKAPTKVAISIRVDRDALATYRATGRGWQTRLAADVERGAARLRRKRAS